MKKISLFILFILFSTTVTALGIIPSDQYVIYKGDNSINITFSIVNKDSKEINLKLFTDETDLANDTTLPTDNLIIKPNSEKSVTLQIKLSKEYNPGTHKARIFIQQIVPPEEFLNSGSNVGALPAVAFPIELIVPKEGKHLIGKFQPIRPINAGEPAYISLLVINVGSEELYNVEGPIDIINEQGKIIETITTTQIQTLPTTAEGELRALWKSPIDITPGPFNLNAKINYGGERPANINGHLDIGGVYIDILGMSTSKIKSNNIGKFILDVKSEWNKDLENVYADMIIKQGNNELAKLKSNTKTISALQSDKLEAFWEIDEIEPNTELTAQITLHYQDKTTEKTIKFRSDSPEQIKLWNNINTILVSISILLILICIVLVIKISKNKK